MEPSKEGRTAYLGEKGGGVKACFPLINWTNVFFPPSSFVFTDVFLVGLSFCKDETGHKASILLVKTGGLERYQKMLTGEFVTQYSVWVANSPCSCHLGAEQ